MGCPTGLMVSFQNEHAASSPGTQGGTAKTPNAAADHHHINRLVGHSGHPQVIIVLAVG